jgi:hypothetical protein
LFVVEASALLVGCLYQLSRSVVDYASVEFGYLVRLAAQSNPASRNAFLVEERTKMNEVMDARSATIESTTAIVELSGPGHRAWPQCAGGSDRGASGSRRTA